jgi:dihydrodipicolinate synthase/N-acetylneuraminate lyase
MAGEQQPAWRGIYPALCTPFTANGAIDVAAQRRVVRFALDCGAHGLVAFGLAGEVLKLRPDERKVLTDAILDEVDERVPVFVGAGAESLSAACELARHAEHAGAACVVLPAPQAGSASEDALVDYFARVAGAVSIPVMIQDAPAYLGIGLGPGIVARAAASAENIRLVKLEAGPAEMGHWFETLGPEFAVWGGDGGVYLLDCTRSGAAGIIPGVDLVDLLVEVYDADAAGDAARADELFRRVLPILVFQIQQSIDHYNSCAKHVLIRRGILEHAALRPPAAPFGETSLTLLDRHLALLDLAGDGVGAGH